MHHLWKISSSSAPPNHLRPLLLAAASFPSLSVSDFFVNKMKSFNISLDKDHRDLWRWCPFAVCVCFGFSSPSSCTFAAEEWMVWAGLFLLYFVWVRPLHGVVCRTSVDEGGFRLEMALLGNRYDDENFSMSPVVRWSFCVTSLLIVFLLLPRRRD